MKQSIRVLTPTASYEAVHKITHPNCVHYAPTHVIWEELELDADVNHQRF